jgi:spermidine/putrescine-binding protein
MKGHIQSQENHMPTAMNRIMPTFLNGSERLLLMITMLIFLFLTAGCGDASGPDANQTETAGSSAPANGESSRLVLYNWEDYLGENTLRQFEEATGIAVELHTYEDDEEIIAAIQSGAFDGDLVILSESVAAEMVKARLLSALDMDVLPNAAHIDPRYLWPDPQTGEHFKFPYLMGTTGLVVNTKYVPEPFDTWGVLWDSKLRGRLAMLNNPFETIAAASFLLGHGINPGPDQLEEIEQKLQEQKPLLVGYLDAVSIETMIVREELWAGLLYSGDGLLAVEQNPDLAFVIPREGCAAWIDVFVMPLHARNKEAALAFINFVHHPEVMGEISSELWTATPNLGARPFTDSEVLRSPIVHPPDEVVRRCEYFDDMGDAESVRQRLKIWSELLADD